MPTYSYKCTQCSHTFDLFQKITDLPCTDCPMCHGAGTVQRGIGGGSAILHFQGSGYYITDYKEGGGEGSAISSPAASKKCSCGKPSSGCKNS